MASGGWRANLGRFRVDGSSDPSIPASVRQRSIWLYAYAPKCRRHAPSSHQWRRVSVPLIRPPLPSPAPACGLARRHSRAISTNSPVNHIGAVSGVHHARAPRYCLREEVLLTCAATCCHRNTHCQELRVYGAQRTLQRQQVSAKTIVYAWPHAQLKPCP